MRNIRLVIEYEGTNYSGWQAQSHAVTIQGTLVSAIKEMTGEDVVLSGASRTDAGVHAMHQVANFKTESKIPVYGLLHGLNSILPPDISIKEVDEAPPEFDSRRDSKGKIYIYRILNRPYPSALLRNFCWHVFKPLDIERMREAAAHMIGEKDFSSFRAADSDSPHSIREVTSIEIIEKGEGLLEIEVRGIAFLRHMVRIMVGTLVAAGKGKITPADVKNIIEAQNRAAAGQTAPPQGLVLVKVEY